MNEISALSQRKHMHLDVGGAMGDQSPGAPFALGSSKEVNYVKFLIYQM